MDVQTMPDISRMVLLSANTRKPYMPRQLAQQWMTLSDLEWSFYASRAICVVADLLVQCTRSHIVQEYNTSFICCNCCN